MDLNISLSVAAIVIVGSYLAWFQNAHVLFDYPLISVLVPMIVCAILVIRNIPPKSKYSKQVVFLSMFSIILLFSEVLFFIIQVINHL